MCIRDRSKKLQNCSPVVAGVWIIRLEENGLVDQFKRERTVPSLIRDQPKKMQRDRVVGRYLQYLPIEGFRLGPLSVCVVDCSFLEQHIHPGMT